MRPHCVKYVVLLNCVSLYTLLSLCVQCCTEDVAVCYLYVTLVVLIMMCTNPYRMDGPH